MRGSIPASLRRLALTLLAACAFLLLTGCPARQARPAPPGGRSGVQPPGAPAADGGVPPSPLDLAALPALPPLGAIRPSGQVREFQLTAARGRWELLPGVVAENAALFNRTTPGPEIRVTEGDTVRVKLTNNLDRAITIHWHGLHVRNPVDGVPPLTQDPVRPGETYTYEFTASHAGSFIYHPHLNSVELVDRGLYGAFIVDPQPEDDQPRFDRDYTLLFGGWMIGVMSGMRDGAESGRPYGGMEGVSAEIAAARMDMDYNYWTINGRPFPASAPIRVKQGERVRLRLINVSNAAHPMHLHGMDFRVIAKDGHPVERPQVQTVVNVAPGETYDIEFLADNPGKWVFHCHELHHATNNGEEPGGLTTVVVYE